MQLLHKQILDISRHRYGTLALGQVCDRQPMQFGARPCDNVCSRVVWQRSDMELCFFLARYHDSELSGISFLEL